MLYNAYDENSGRLAQFNLAYIFYVSLPEQRATLHLADYSVKDVLIKGGRAFYRALPAEDESPE